MRVVTALAATLVYGVLAVSGKSVSHPACSVDNCIRAVEATLRNAAVQASRKADCKLYLASTVTPSVITVYTTVTSVAVVESTAGSTASGAAVQRRDAVLEPRTTSKTKTTPSYAKPCTSATRYASACSCAGITGSTVTLAAQTFTSTVVISSISTDVVSMPSYSPASPVTMPPFDDWTSTYTYEEATLPTFPPFTPLSLPTPSPTTQCFLNPTQTDAAFYLLDQHTGDYLYNNAGSLGPIAVPTDPAVAAAWKADVANIPDPVQFAFETPANAPAGFYDIVLVGSSPKQYIAIKSTGDMVLTKTSTNGATVKGLSTTIFSVSCRGQMQVMQGTTTYIWQVNGKTTKATAGDPTKMTSMVMLPESGYKSPATLLQMVKNSPPPGSSTKARRVKRNVDEEGMAPRCPNYPQDVTAILTGSSGMTDGGCGPWDGIGGEIASSIYEFDDCCDFQQGCFGSCLLQFEECELIYSVCLFAKCADWFDDIWTIPVGIACLGLAGYYTYSAWTDLAITAWYQSNQKDCTCMCDDRSLTTCPSGGGNYACIDVHGSDSNNCGGCGNQCGGGAHCASGECRCNHDRCGNLCVNLATHPRNCGTCGHVCASGYCFLGTCYDPPPNPSSCIAMDAVMNGGFTQGQAYWTQGGDDGTRVLEWSQHDDHADPGNVAAGDSVAALIYMPTGGKSLWISQKIHICPGQQYQLEFQMRRFHGDGDCTWKVTMPAGLQGEKYYLADNINLPTTGDTWPYGGTWGPINLPVYNADSPLVTPASRFYVTVDLDFTITCWSMYNIWQTRSEASIIFLDSITVFPADV